SFAVSCRWCGSTRPSPLTRIFENQTRATCAGLLPCTSSDMPMQRTKPSPSWRSARSPARKRCIHGLEIRRIAPGPVRWKNHSVLRDMFLPYHASAALGKRAQPCSASDSVFDQLAQQRSVAVCVLCAGAGTEQRDGLTCAHPRGELVDARAPSRHFREEALPVLFPGDRRSALSVDVCMQRAAWPEIRVPFVPCLLRFAHPARPVAADEQAQAVSRQPAIVPAARANWHFRS